MVCQISTTRIELPLCGPLPLNPPRANHSLLWKEGLVFPTGPRPPIFGHRLNERCSAASGRWRLGLSEDLDFHRT